MDQDTFEGRTTFPTENTDETNKFILRYIAKEWPGLTYRTSSSLAFGAYIIVTRVCRLAHPSLLPEYTLNGMGSFGIMSMDRNWWRDGFILDLKGKEFKIINNFLEDPTSCTAHSRKK